MSSLLDIPPVATRLSVGLLALILTGCADLALEADRVPTELEIQPRGRVLSEDEAVQLDIVVRDQNGDRMPLPSWTPLAWEVSEPSFAEVDRGGLFTPLQGGEVFVHAKLAGLQDTVRFRINPDQVVLSAPVIYLNQAAQNRDGSVALIAGRPALIWVFMVGDQVSFYGPSVRVTLLQGDTVVFREVLTAATERTPKGVRESRLDGSVNGVIPGSVIQTGVRMVVELDPEGSVPLAPGSQTRYPAEGSMEVHVVEPQTFRQIIVPTLEEESPDESVFIWTEDLNPESPQMRMARALMPIASMETEIHSVHHTGADLSTEDGWHQWIGEMHLLFLTEGRRGYYYGVAAVPIPAYLGLGFLGSPVSVGVPEDYVYAHELGHNMNLLHAPCGTQGYLDPDYPYVGGRIGIWGYDIRDNQLLDPNHYRDVMGYCPTVWISDYHFTIATNHRLNGDGGVELDAGSAAGGAGTRGEVLVVWGSVRHGRVQLDPSFVLDGPAVLPETEGPYRVEGLAGDGRTEFSLSFTPAPLEFGGGGFVFLVPWEADWADSLDRLVLTGPEGEFTLTRSGTPPMAVVTDPSTGRIQAIIRDWDGGPLAGEGTADVTVTRGISGGK